MLNILEKESPVGSEKFHLYIDSKIFGGEKLVATYYHHIVPEESDAGKWSGLWRTSDGGSIETVMFETREACREFLDWALSMDLTWNEWAEWLELIGGDVTDHHRQSLEKRIDIIKSRRTNV